jgi:hypothetical protein
MEIEQCRQRLLAMCPYLADNAAGGGGAGGVDGSRGAAAAASASASAHIARSSGLGVVVNPMLLLTTAEREAAARATDADAKTPVTTTAAGAGAAAALGADGDDGDTGDVGSDAGNTRDGDAEEKGDESSRPPRQQCCGDAAVTPLTPQSKAALATLQALPLDVLLLRWLNFQLFQDVTAQEYQEWNPGVTATTSRPPVKSVCIRAECHIVCSPSRTAPP